MQTIDSERSLVNLPLREVMHARGTYSYHIDPTRETLKFPRWAARTGVEYKGHKIMVEVEGYVDGANDKQGGGYRHP